MTADATASRRDSWGVGEVAAFAGVSPATVRRWIRAGQVTAIKESGRYLIPRDENIDFVLAQMRKEYERPEEPWVPADLVTYADWHTVIDELVWLLKVTFSDREALKKREFRLDQLLQRHVEANVGSLRKVRSSFSPAKSLPRELVEDDLLRGWYNELSFAFPLRSSTLGLRFRDVEANKKDAEIRFMFPSWRFIQAYYAIYFYARCLCQMKTSTFRLERHGATLNTFSHGVLASCESTIWPWPLSIRYSPGRRVRRSTLPPWQRAHLGYRYARHPRAPHRTPQQSYEFVREQLQKRAKIRGNDSTYTLVDFLYDFRVWANYRDIDSLLALWGPGYRAIIDMNLGALLFFIASSAEIAFAASLGEEAYLGKLQHLYDGFVSRDDHLRREFPSCPLYQRLQVLRGTGIVTSGIRLTTDENPHAVELIRPSAHQADRVDIPVRGDILHPQPAQPINRTLDPIQGVAVRAAVEQFFSDLHRQYLKPAGYRKVRHNFSRAMDGYTEHFGFQGSAWNDAAGAWRFYINVGVDFPDSSNRLPVRIEHVVPGAPQHFDLPEPDHDAFARTIAELLASASEQIAAQLPEIRQAFSQQRYWVGF